MRWEDGLTAIGQMRNATLLLGRPKWKRLFGIRGLLENIKIDLTGVRSEI
jgi:hypothetical protein